MASGNKSRWGSLISQAVAGVEARLDTILAEEDGSPKNTKASPASGATPTSAVSSSAKATPAPSRTSSSSRANDRLQERLARAMAAKAAAKKQDTSSDKQLVPSQPSPRQSLDTTGRPSTESADLSSISPSEPASQRASQDVPRRSSDSAPGPASEPGDRSDKDEKDSPDKKEDATSFQTQDKANGKKEAVDMTLPQNKPDTVESSSRTLADLEVPPVTSIKAPEPTATGASKPTITEASELTTTDAPGPAAEEPEEEQEDPSEAAKRQHQDEIHGYVERIDALEAKLQYLAREAGEAARKEALTAAPGSAEKKLAEKDQQIAQLMEEGKNLASTEQKHRAIIKKMRAKIAEDEKELKNLKTTQEKLSQEIEPLRIRARRADELQKANEELRRRLELSQKEVNSLRPDVRAKDATIKDLNSKLEKATKEAEAATARINAQAREQDKKRIAELEESVAALQVEKSLVADRAKIQANDLREKAERADERVRALEVQMRDEMQAMERKLEAMRVQAEEVSSGAGGDTQAKLLRQVETLQTQYSIASENWQGIESTMLARIANLEKERDEALQRESDMRKKAREASLRAKRTEEELEEARSRVPSLQEDLQSHQSQLESLRKRATEAEAALQQMKVEVEKQKQIHQAAQEEKQQQQDRDNDRRGGWLEDVSRSNSRPESPLLMSNPQRTFSSDGLLGFEMLPNKFRKPSAPSSNGAGYSAGDRLSRRPSFQPPSVRPPLTTSSSSNNPLSPQPVFSPTMDALATPSLNHPLDDVESQHRFDGAETPASPHQVLQDMVSVSTVAAGPSVQLVERMSAAIRRLESEKVAAKEELSRISKQRDEARAELVAMMREVENGKAAVARVEELEQKVAETEAKYEATLEELGEKLELVEELKADVQDVKDMYRELVERTVR